MPSPPRSPSVEDDLRTRPPPARDHSPSAALVLTGRIASARAPAAAADRTFALVGSLQSELGCPDDWQPELRRDRPRADGHGRRLRRRVRRCPAGSYEYKVAVNDAWDETYGPERRRRQHPAHRRRARRRSASSSTTRPHRVGVEVVSLRGGLHAPTTTRSSPRPSARPGSDEQFYFVMTDRFANGDAVERHGGHRRRPPRARVRPDRQGLLQRRRHRGSAREPRLHRGSRHDRDLADAELQEPAGAGHRRRTPAPATTATGSPTSRRSTRTSAPTPSSRRSSTTPTPRASRSTSTSSRTTPPTSSRTQEGQYAYVDKTTSPYTRRRRHGVRPRRRTRAPTPSRRSTPRPRSRTRPVVAAADRTSRCPAWLNDPTLYHNRGDSTWAGESVTYGDFSGSTT